MMESGTKGAINYKMNHQKGPTGGDGTKTESDSQKCRSLVCDSTGIIIAEMVYRCMICNSVTDSITEAKAHYQMNHMEEDEEQEEDYKFSPSESMRYQSPYNQQQQQSAASGRSAADHQNRQSSSSSFRNPLVPDVSLYEDNSPLPLKFGNNNNNNNNLMHNHNNNVLSYKGNHSGECGEHDSAWLTCSPCPHPSSLGPMEHGASQTAQGQMTATATNGSNTKSGYVNCAVCGVTRFYSCVQRRYGQFTCVTCYRYFRTFLLKPKRYACPNLGSCPLNVRTRCRACWIKGCISVFSVDSRRQAVIEANLPVRRIPTSPVKTLLPPPPPLASFADSNGQAGDDDGDQSPSHDSEKAPSGYDAMLEPEVSLTEDADGDNGEDEAIDADEDGELDASSVAEDMSDQQPQPRHLMMQHATPPKLVSAIRPSLNKLIVTGKKVWSCGKCMTCTAEDCGKCIYCLDRPKFGGPFIKKQRCIKRRCLMKIKNKNNTLLRK